MKLVGCHVFSLHRLLLKWPILGQKIMELGPLVLPHPNVPLYLQIILYLFVQYSTYTYMCGFPTTKMSLVSPLHSHEQRNTSCYSNTPHATFSMASFPGVSKDSRTDFNSYLCQWSNPSWEGGHFTIPGIPYEKYWENCKSQPTNLIQKLTIGCIFLRKNGPGHFSDVAPPQI